MSIFDIEEISKTKLSHTLLVEYGFILKHLTCGESEWEKCFNTTINNIYYNFHIHCRMHLEEYALIVVRYSTLNSGCWVDSYNPIDFPDIRCKLDFVTTMGLIEEKYKQLVLYGHF